MMTHAIQDAPLGHYRVKHVVKSEIAQDPDPAIDRHHRRPHGRRRLVGDRAGDQRRLCTTAPAYYFGFDPTQNSLTGLIVAGLTGGVFGALLITGEYSSGTIRATLAATPRRPILLAAKIGVAAAVTVVFCELLSFVSFFLGQAILSGGGAPSASLGSPAPLRAVVMTGVFIALMALMSFGFGLILRSTAGGDRRLRRRRVRAPARDARHLRTRPSLRADQHPHQLDHVHRQPRAWRDQSDRSRRP